MTDSYLLLNGHIGQAFVANAQEYFEYLANGSRPMAKRCVRDHRIEFTPSSSRARCRGLIDIKADLHFGSFIRQRMFLPIRPQKTAIFFDNGLPSIGISLPDAEADVNILSDPGSQESKLFPASKQRLAICWPGYEPWLDNLPDDIGMSRQWLARCLANVVRRFFARPPLPLGPHTPLPIGPGGVTANDVVLMGLIQTNGEAAIWQPILKLQTWVAEPQDLWL